MHHALSVDVEEYFQVSNLSEAFPRARWDDLPSRVEAQTRRLLDLFDGMGQRGTFFALGWVARRHPGLLREIAARGHEVACHGDGHELVYAIGPARFREDLRRARSAIADAVGHPPAGYRAPSFSITPRSRWALSILAEEGFAYDSSVFPVRHPRYGWIGFPPGPVRLDLPGGLAIDEFPPTSLGLGPLRLPVAGGAYLRFLPGAVFRSAWTRATDAGRPGLLYVHPWELDPEQPRAPVGWRVRVNHYHGLRATLGKLRTLLGAHAFAPLVEVLDELRVEKALPRTVPPREPVGDGGVASLQGATAGR